MEISDPYEQKLYHMFTSHDIESKGSLDKAAISKLCKTLELKDREPVLVACLLNGNANNRVTFKGFKEGLLNLLGTDADDSNGNEQNSHNFSEDETVIGEQSPSREVSPKFVVGSKKYGRRSRPQSAAFDSSQSESDNEYVSVVPTSKQEKLTKTQKVQRSSSHSDIHGTKRRRPVTGTKLKRCASLPAHKPKKEEKPLLQTQLESSVESLGNLDFENLSCSLYDVWNDYGINTDNLLNQSQLEKVCEQVGLRKIANKVAAEVFEKLGRTPNSRISFNDFIALIQSDSDIPPADDSSGIASTERDSSCAIEGSPSHDLHVHSEEWPVESSAVPVDVIIDMWESAGITNAKNLLDNLGFNSKEIHISQLSLVIDEDLQSLHGCSEEAAAAPLLRASLALHKAEVSALQQAFRQLADENRKIHSNNRDANRRAALLAQEVDERHAHLENSARSEIRLLEQRHADIVRDLTAQLANDREHWSSVNAKLEIRIKTLETEDTKNRNDIISLQNENSALESEQISLQKQITDLLEENIKLNNEIVDMVERQRNEESFKSDRENEEVVELIEKISLLQVENSNLRDKNDELVTEVEDKCLEISKLKAKKQSRTECLSNDDSSVDVEYYGNLGTKRRGDSPSKAKISEESPRLGKLRKCSNDTTEGESEGSGDWITLNSELNQTSNPQTANTTSGFSQEFSSLSDYKDDQIKQLKTKLAELELVLGKQSLISEEIDITDSHPNIVKIKDRNKELESSLEQMRKEYEDCEDYWQDKLNVERQLYEEEQRVSNDKFIELVKKIAEYEDQLAVVNEKDGRLSPIEEKCHLEQQYADLEAEIEEIKEQANQLLEKKSSEILSLEIKINDLKQSIGEQSEICPSTRVSDVDSPASSPISYLWHQSTILAPARDYHNPNWNAKPNTSDLNNDIVDAQHENNGKAITPIQRPQSPLKQCDNTKEANISDSSSVKSLGTHSVASTHSIHRSFADPICTSPNILRENIKRLKLMELQLKDVIQEMTQQRDCLVMELQQLQEAKPALEKAYARTNHPSLMQRIQQLEQKNRHLQNCLKQQQHYTETIVHQTWQQQRTEINELRHRLEAQGIIITEQAQRLANADILVKDLYVENSQLSAAIQRLEQQRSRNNLILQHQGLTGVPGMPSI